MIVRTFSKILGAGVLLAGAFATTAFAHAHLQSSAPAKDSAVAAPSEVVLTFNEPVTPALMTLADQDGHDVKGIGAPRAEGNALHLPITAKLAAGHYTVSYRIAGPDTHVVTGTLTFTVAKP